MSFKLPGLERRVFISPAKLALLVFLAPVLALLFVGFDLWRTQNAIKVEMPPLVRRFTPQPEGTPPAFVFPTPAPSTPGATAAPFPTLAPGAATPPAGEPTFPPLPSAMRTGEPAPTPPVSRITDWHGKRRITVLLLGLDRREDEPTRPDTIILATLDFERNRADVLSVPRDLYVRVPGGYRYYPANGFGYHKINAAYPIGENPKYADDQEIGGGVGLLINTLQQNFSIPPPDAYMTVDFDGFVQGVDALGGIDVYVPKEIIDKRYPKEDGRGYRWVVFRKGWLHLDGARALQYSRTRHGDDDYGRIRRQWQVIEAVQQKARNPSTILRAPQLLGVVRGNVKTTVTDVQDQLRLARWAASLPSESLEFHTIPGTVVQADGQSVVWADPAVADPILQRVFGPQARLRR